MTATRRTRLRMLPAALLLAPLLLAACGSSDSSSATGSISKPPVTPANAKGCRDAAAAAAINEAPTVTIPEDVKKAPFATDEIPGCGPVIKKGDTIWVGYVLKSAASGKVVDDSWKSGTPLNVTLGEGQVIEGWDRGLVGMRVGGRRVLVIPPQYGYGKAGNPPVIAKNDTLVFVVDALASVKTQATPSTAPGTTPN